ncbi:LOW QUALITY PROTEIN: olfactory receptor 2AT4-like [Amia ocellicauda]|uniref:LOW QUALITY PROTEIN: olfactory receptor 2AT4-like n=1 Tax=Amia ocellicauda TaxID=2972642 RepID=UPI003463D823
MSDPNSSLPSAFHFIIKGMPGLQDYYSTLFFIFLLLFLATILGNLLIVVLVSLDPRLHTPMYFFLWNLALLDVLLTTTVIPKMLAVLLGHNRTISFAGCFLQMYLFISFGATETFLVAAMAYDRYVAVVKPLHYNSIISTKVCFTMTATVWAVGFLVPMVSVALASSVPYCTSNHVLHVVCDYTTVVSLSCTDVTAQVNFALLLAMVVVCMPFLFVLWSYCRIIISVVKMKTVESRKKAFSMCSTHVVVVVLYYVSTAMEYISLRVDSSPHDGHIFIGGLNYFITPLVNPIIYSLRNEKIKAAAQRYFCRRFCSLSSLRTSFAIPPCPCV